MELFSTFMLTSEIEEVTEKEIDSLKVRMGGAPGGFIQLSVQLGLRS